MAVLQSTLKLTLLDQVSARARVIGGSFDRLAASQKRLMAPLTGGMAQFLALAGAYVGVTEGIRGTIGAAMAFESAFADVRKVVDATDEQFQNMERSIRKLSTVMPTTATDLAALYAAGGEGGIATNELEKFAIMAARVGIAFDLPAAKAGEDLAHLKAQLGLTLTETGDLADVMNHLSNTMASKASDITTFMLKVGKLAEMGGLAKEEIAALGSAMLSAGAEPEVAATALQNVVKAMTRGTSAKKAQKDVAKALGLNLPQLAKEMQKDAPAAIKKVLAAIAKAPKDRHISLLSDFFGDEAKAFAPLVGNIKLLDDALDSVGDKTKYAGSAYREYIERSKTTANVLQILQNKFAELGRSIGDDMLPGVKDAALGIGDVIDTLDQRAHIFDDIKYAMKGFMQGLGFDGNLRSAMKEIGDFLLGPADGSKSADELGRIFMKFKGWGEDIKWFADQVDAGVKRFEKAFNLKPGTVGETLGEIGSWGMTLGLSSIGISLAATAIGALATALYRLSGASLLIGGAKGLASLFGALSGVAPSAGKVVSTAAAGANAATSVKPGGVPLPTKLMAEWDKLGKFAKGFAVLQAISGAYDAVKNSSSEGRQDSVDGARSTAKSLTELLFGEEIANRPDMPANSKVDQPDWVTQWNALVSENGRVVSLAVQSALASTSAAPAGVAQQMAIQNSMFPGKQKDDFDVGRKTVTIDAASISAMVTPRGTQDVRVTNKEPPVIHMTNSFTITGVIDPKAAATSAASQLGEKVRSAVESANTD